MKKYTSEFKRVHDSISGIVGKPVQLRGIKGRRRFLIKDCTINHVYNNLFTVEYKDKNGATKNMCFSFADILTSSVRITVV